MTLQPAPGSMEATRRYIERHFPHPGILPGRTQPSDLADTMDAAVLAHAYARKHCDDDPLGWFARMVAPVIEREGYEGIRKWADNFRDTGALWASDLVLVQRFIGKTCLCPCVPCPFRCKVPNKEQVAR